MISENEAGSKNKGENFRKYLLYALGEIILVVIGILIAVRINDWNNTIQHNKEEIRILSGLKNDVTNDTIQLAENIRASHLRISKMDSVYIALLHPNEYSSGEFLQHAYVLAGSNEFNVNSGTFDESLAASTLKYIRNEQLRQHIFEYYRKAKINTIDNYATRQKYDVVFPTMFKTLSVSKDFMENFIGKETVFPAIDIESLSANSEFLAAVNQRYASEKNQINYWTYFKRTSQKLLEELEAELE